MSYIPPSWIFPPNPTPSSLSSLRFPETILSPPRRRVFVTYSKTDQLWADAFVRDFGPDGQSICDPTALGVSDEDDFVRSTNTDYIMSQIKAKYIEDRTVTVVLMGECTHSRKYVDWEIKSSLRQEGPFGLPNGLLGILVPPNTTAYMPPRFNLNYKGGYAKLYLWPQNGSELRTWIEDAVSMRTSPNKIVENPQWKLEQNQICSTHGYVH